MKQQNYLSDIVQSTADDFRVGGAIQLHVNGECVGTVYMKANVNLHMTRDDAAYEAQHFYNKSIEGETHQEIIEKLLNYIAYFETVGRHRLITQDNGEDETLEAYQEIVSLISVLSGYKFWQSVADLNSDGWMSRYVIQEITIDRFIDIVVAIESEEIVLH